MEPIQKIAYDRQLVWRCLARQQAQTLMREVQIDNPPRLRFEVVVEIQWPTARQPTRQRLVKIAVPELLLFQSLSPCILRKVVCDRVEIHLLCFHSGGSCLERS